MAVHFGAYDQLGVGLIYCTGEVVVPQRLVHLIRAQERLVEALDDDELNNVMELMGKLILSNNEGSRARWKLTGEKKQ